MLLPFLVRCHLLPLLLAVPFAVHFANAKGAKVHFVLIFSLIRIKTTVALVGLASAKQARVAQARVAQLT
jgi:hypothetical protein